MTPTQTMSQLITPDGISVQTHPDRYRHWKVAIDGPVATLTMDVDEEGGLNPGYVLKLNSYDLGVDIELYDATQRLRFEHPEVKAVVITGVKGEKVFCAGANIQMLAQSTHQHKVNFCKFTNETRNGIEDATANSGQTYIAAINGTASGGGYELALACDRLILVDDRSSAVSLPEIPLLAVLPGTGGLTRLVDKRMVRHDIADVFATKAEGMRGEQALEAGLVDEIVPKSSFDEVVVERARELAGRSSRLEGGRGVELTELKREISESSITYDHVRAAIRRAAGTITVTVPAPAGDVLVSADAAIEEGSGFWPLAVCRELDDLILHLRFNEPKLGTIIFNTEGSAANVLAMDGFLVANKDNWFVHEVLLYWKRLLKRIDLTSRSLFALVEPGSCFVGLLLELALAADRIYMLDDSAHPAALALSPINFGPMPMSNDLTRLQTRFLGQPGHIGELEALVGKELSAREALELGLVTAAPDDIDWDDEVRLALEERASFSPDALIGMEANFRFAGPETMETKIFARLSAWQNWIFQRPNAAGEEGGLRRYGTGQRPKYNTERI